MIDLHCHILPGVDDGPRDAADSGRMLDLARCSGTTTIVATPHADLRYRFDPLRCRELLIELQALHPAPRLCPGCEVHLTPENIAKVLADPSAFTLNGGDCLLLELPDRMLPDMVEPAIEALMHAGLRVILAHPERNSYIQHAPSYSEHLVDAGCFLQLTGRSLSGSFGHAATVTANYILKRRLAHCIASDAHGSTIRRPGLTSAFARVTQGYGEPAAKMLMIDNPDAALHSASISSMPNSHGWIASLFARPATPINRNQPAASTH